MHNCGLGIRQNLEFKHDGYEVGIKKMLLRYIRISRSETIMDFFKVQIRLEGKFIM